MARRYTVIDYAPVDTAGTLNSSIVYTPTAPHVLSDKHAQHTLRNKKGSFVTSTGSRR